MVPGSWWQNVNKMRTEGVVVRPSFGVRHTGFESSLCLLLAVVPGQQTSSALTSRPLV